MRSRPSRSRRQRVYAMVTLGLVCVFGLVAMSSMLARGHQELTAKVYKFPHRTLVHLAKAQNRYFRKDLDGDAAPDFAESLEELEAAGLITGRLASGELEGYRYRIVRADGQTWAGEATPAVVTSTTLFYYIDQSYVVRASEDGPAGPDSDVFWSPRDAGWGR